MEKSIRPLMNGHKAMISSLRNSRTPALAVVALAFLFANGGCGKVQEAEGSGGNGLLSYSISADYDIPDTLSEARLATRIRQVVRVSLTDRGKSDVEKPWLILHEADPNDGVTVETVGASDVDGAEHPGQAMITVTNPGEYKVISKLDGTTVDYITLTFADIATIDVSCRVREPYGTEWVDREETVVETPQGSQIEVSVVPKTSASETAILSSGVETMIEVTADPTNHVAPETEPTWADSTHIMGVTARFYLILSGEVTFTVTEPLSQAKGGKKFWGTALEEEESDSR